MKIGIFGYGHLGKIHRKCLNQTPFEIAGIYDPKYITLQQIDGIEIYADEDALMDDCDVCLIASTTSAHYQTAINALNRKKHFFVEKPTKYP